jgi:alkaline phosphatase D
MLGYSDMFEVKLWVQTKAAAKVQIAYWEKGTSSQPLLTEVVQTQKSQGFTAHLVADKVKPDKLYQYELRINNLPVKLDYPTYFQTQQLWNWRRDPPKFKLALGSCAYINEEAFDRPGKPYGGDYHIFKAMHEQRPDLMIWMGDNYYLREPDWNTKTGFIHRITHTRSLPELQPFLASTHHYAVWDDHDYGPNDSDRSFIHKDMATEVFKMFWGNPVYGLPGEGGITSYFSWGDCDFFLLDNRYFRKPNNRKTSECTILGEHQLEWLIDALTFSKAKFKFVVMGGQMLNSSANYETYINLCPEEQAYLLKCIEDESLKNVVFLTGDRHHSELSKIVNAKGNVIYDFTVSPLTAGVNINPEENLNRVEGTLVKERNFGIIEFEGPFNQRKLRFKIFNSNGVEIWSQEIMAQ